MTIQAAALHTDSAGRLTSSEYGDRGDGVNAWHETATVADGGDVTQGAIGDTSETDTTQDASVIALLKGIIDSSRPVAPGTVAATVALATSLVVKASAGQLLSIVGYSTVTQYIQIHDSTTLPADAAVPDVVIPITAGAPFSIDFGELGLDLATGIVVSNSTTGPTKTIGAADTWITAIYR